MAKYNVPKRELEALIAYARCGSQLETAQFLGVHTQTVKNRILEAKKAIGAVSTTQAIWMLLDGESKADDLLVTEEE